ncbi:MAG: hypothetical protein GY774_08120, partial [Planctomycetes bacterium]|nr:hypothetical protein [Planctomycetota bacterium]
MTIKNGVVEFTLTGELPEGKSANIDEFVQDVKAAIVNRLGLELGDIDIMEIRKGSIVVKGILSKRAIEKLKNLDEQESVELGIVEIKLIHDSLVSADLGEAKLSGA